MKRIPTLCAVACALACLAAAGAALAADGAEPMNLAVSPAGDTVLITSLASNSITQFHDGVRSHVDVGGTTWGVAFVDDLTAVVTHHDQDRLTVLTRTSVSAAFTAADVHPYGFGGFDLTYSTEVCVDPDAAVPTFYVANRGESVATTGDDSWRHQVHEFVLDGAGVPSWTRSFPVDREPRALAVATAGSPATSVLYVGHVQGTLGNQLAADPVAATPWDGGTMLAIDLASTDQTRFELGSPVRDVAVRPDGAGGYRVFVTHVGEGALSEDPLNGGLVIPNVITSFGFDSGHAVVDREDIIINHITELQAGDDPAVLPEQVAFSSFFDGATTHHFAWITNAASGTVTRLVLQADGHAPSASTSWSLIGFASQQGAAYQVVSSRNTNGKINLTDATSTNVVDDFLMPPATDVTIVPVDAGPATVPMSSVPRGIVARPVTDEMLVVTQLDNELVTLSADDPPNQTVSVTSVAVTDAPVTVPAARRNFFAAGAGFAFREVDRPGSSFTIPAEPQVDNLSCTTCHPGVNHDGKIHVSNAAGQVEPVVTPTLFDTGNSEWLFFNGLRTVEDDAGQCSYCLDNSFFFNTKSFTLSLDSPASPYAEPPGGGGAAELTTAEANGRGWFDAMNCTRCHQGVMTSFPRTSESAVVMQGPLVLNPTTAERLLNDRTQSMVTFDNAPISIDGMSVRNRTDVGTRRWEGGATQKAVNTPVLAGSWDNRPYMHDGRYPTLDAVLDDTWLFLSPCAPQRRVAARFWSCSNRGPVPDNFSSSRNIAAGEHLTAGLGDVPFGFETHSPFGPGGRISARTYLTNHGAYDDVVAFLLALSAETDPCSGTAGGLAIGDVDVTVDGGAGTTTVSWTTNLPVACEVAATLPDDSTDDDFTDPGVIHEFEYDHTTSPYVALDLSAELRLCGTAADPVAFVPVAVYGWQAHTDIACTETQIQFKVNAPVACLFEWGPKNRQGNYAYSFTTSAAYEQDFDLPVDPNVRYMARITPQVPGAASYGTFYFNAYPCALILGGKSQDAPTVETGLASIHPNPFNPATTVAFGMQAPGRVQVRVYDVMGRLVRTLTDREYAVGRHELTWNGRDDGGRGVASGIYLVRFETGDLQQVQRISLLK